MPPAFVMPSTTVQGPSSDLLWARCRPVSHCSVQYRTGPQSLRWLLLQLRGGGSAAVRFCRGTLVK